MSYKFDTIVNRKEADALKEMIFNRVKERSQSLNEETQSDVMDLARDSFVSKDNPFSRIVDTPVSSGGTINDNKAASVRRTEDAKSTPEVPKDTGLGFPHRASKTGAANQNRIINEQLSTAVVNGAMKDARVGLSNKQSFMGALNFLNSQAAISLIKTRADRFEVLV